MCLVSIEVAQEQIMKIRSNAQQVPADLVGQTMATDTFEKTEKETEQLAVK